MKSFWSFLKYLNPFYYFERNKDINLGLLIRSLT